MELDCRVKAFLADQKCTVEIKGVAEECPFKADFRAHVGALLNITPEHVRPDDGPLGTAAVLGFQSWARNRTRATLTYSTEEDPNRTVCRREVWGRAAAPPAPAL